MLLLFLFSPPSHQGWREPASGFAAGWGQPTTDGIAGLQPSVNDTLQQEV